MKHMKNANDLSDALRSQWDGFLQTVNWQSLHPKDIERLHSFFVNVYNHGLEVDEAMVELIMPSKYDEEVFQSFVRRLMSEANTAGSVLSISARIG